MPGPALHLALALTVQCGGPTPCAIPVADPVDIPRRPGVAIGLAANNPLNLSYSPDAAGFVRDRDGNRVAVYPSLRNGISAELLQLQAYQAYQHQGLVTTRQLVTRWVCGQTCTPAQTAVIGGYIADVAAAVRARPDDPIDLGDPATATAFILAAQPHESGALHFSAAADTASASTLPAPAAPPPPAQPQASPQDVFGAANGQQFVFTEKGN